MRRDVERFLAGSMMLVLLAGISGCGSGNVQVTSDPPGAKVYAGPSNIDGTGEQLIGVTPCEKYMPHAWNHFHAYARVEWPDGVRSFLKQASVRTNREISERGYQFHFKKSDYVSPRHEPVVTSSQSSEVQVSGSGLIRHELDRLSGTKREYASDTRDVRGRAWTVVVGVSKYRSAGAGGLSNLSFADNDAKNFAATLQKFGWDADQIRLLVNNEATKRNIEYALETWLRRAGPDDLIVLFWSSHAWPDPEDPTRAYFACYDSKPSDPSSGWRMDRVRQILEERGARNVVVIADTCHAGKIIRAGDPKAIGVVPALEAMKEKQDIPKGWVFIASADPDRKAYEDKAWSNGALTHCLLEGLGGNADGYQSLGPKDGTVTLGELRGYVKDRMAEESLNILGARLVPLFYTTSGDPEIWNLTLRPR